VLVFVNNWEQRGAFARQPDLMVPRALYLPDGRVVPTCTLQVDSGATPSVPEYRLSFPNSYIGGGFLTTANVQGRQHMGSIGCLVTDGDLTYALTNRHVTGTPGREMFTLFSGKRVRIGVSDENQIVSRPFTEIYPGWAGSNVQLHMDAGLIRVEDLADWTAQVASIGPLDEWLDLTTDNLTLDLVGEYVRGFGAASGELRGTIAALFYRYASAAGTDYVTDFLIAPRSGSQSGTLHGDSGTLWFWEQWENEGEKKARHRLRPFAVQWGGQEWANQENGKNTGRFALATSLSTICREMGVTLLRDWNSNLPEYWGAVGHYTIGYFACERISGNLGKLMKANQEIVSYPLDSITSTKKINLRGPGGFVPLADVPDRLWAHGKMIRGSADGSNHFADMDQPDPQNQNKTLLDLCKDAQNIKPDFWLKYYEHVGDKGRGLLPFRVWQFFDEMVDALSQKPKDITRYVCAAGVCAHYVGDACQPLHLSRFHDGEPAGGGKPARGKGVHSEYEDKMLRQNSVTLLDLLKTELGKKQSSSKPPRNGHEAAVLTVGLMRRTFKTIQPMNIVNAFVESKNLWDEFGTKTVKVMADGVRTLSAVWHGAWIQGGGRKVPKNLLGPAPHDELIRLYMRKTWAPSKTLKTIGALLK